MKLQEFLDTFFADFKITFQYANIDNFISVVLYDNCMPTSLFVSAIAGELCVVRYNKMTVTVVTVDTVCMLCYD